MRTSFCILLVLGFGFCSSVSAQPYMQQKTQHRFAQTYFGFNLQATPSQGSMIWNGNIYSFPAMTSPRFTIGGLHFWGKVDFNINIPLATFSDFSLDENTEFKFNPGGDLSARYYPWRMERLVAKFRKEGKLNSFSIAAAPSGSYFLQAPDFEDPMRRSLPRHKGNFVWDLGVGYLFHDAGIHVGFSFRDYTSRIESYDFEHLIRRRSFALEAFKFIWDYNGFVPFIGPTLSFERWATGEFEGNTQLGQTQRKQMISPGIIFGWDILASPLETWVLRTNLRYYPFQRIRSTDGSISRVDQFEFNFIQLVIYPNRLFNYPKIKGRI